MKNEKDVKPPTANVLLNCLEKHMKANKGPSGISTFDLDGNEVIIEPERPGYL